MADLLAYRVEFSSERCRASAFVNDCVVEYTEGFHPLDASAPATPWLRTGINRIGLLVEPMPRARLGPGVEASATLGVHPLGGYPKSQTAITNLSFNGDEDDPIVGSSPSGDQAGPVSVRTTAGGGIMLERDVKVSAPIPVWAWMSSSIMSDTPALRAQLTSAYQEIAERVAARDSAYFRALLRERTMEYRAALHSEADEIPDDYGVSQLRDGAGEVYPIDWQSAKLRIMGNGRLAEYVRWDDEPLIVVDLPVGALYLTFTFRMANGNLIVAR